MIRRIRTVTVAVVALVLGLTAAVPAAAAPIARSEEPQCTDRANSPIDGLVAQAHPVVLVHGWNGAPMWETRRLLERRMPTGWQFLLFDYGPVTNRWAADPEISGCLGRYLQDVSTAHSRRGGDGTVYVVAHSMGGLATRFAADPLYGPPPDAGSDERPSVAGLLGGLVTVAKPHQGSPWGNTGYADLLATLVDVKEDFWPSTGSPAATCLAPHVGNEKLPAGCAPIPYLPREVRVDQVGGRGTVERTYFGFHAYDIDLGGDSVVPLDSAEGYLNSAPGGTAATRGMSVRLIDDRCRVEDMGLVQWAAQYAPRLDAPAGVAGPDLTYADRLLPGTGLAALFAAVKRNGYHGPVSVEVCAVGLEDRPPAERARLARTLTVQALTASP